MPRKLFIILLVAIFSLFVIYELDNLGLIDISIPRDVTYTIDPNLDTDGDNLKDIDEINIYFTNRYNIDSDGDYVKDDIEIEKGTDPTKVFTYGEIDDFNRIYTYELLPYSEEDDQKFLDSLPNVEPRLWDENDGVGLFTTQKNVEISKRDPLIQYLAKRGEILWENGTGNLFVDGERIWNSGKIDESEEMPRQPSYFFTHGRNGNCGVANWAIRSILELMGYDVISVTFETYYENGEKGGHIAPEVSINDEPYVAHFNKIVPREGFYEETGWKIISDYDPDWYKK